MQSLGVKSLCVIAALALIAVGVRAQQAAPQPPAGSPQPPASSPQLLIDRYCVTCHNQRPKTANLALDTLTLAVVVNWTALLKK